MYVAYAGFCFSIGNSPLNCPLTSTQESTHKERPSLIRTSCATSSQLMLSLIFFTRQMD